MGGINSLSGLNSVGVDFRPTVGPNAAAPNTEAPKPDGVDAQQHVVGPDEALPPSKAEAKSVVRQLDVLLVNAARRASTRPSGTLRRSTKGAGCSRTPTGGAA